MGGFEFLIISGISGSQSRMQHLRVSIRVQDPAGLARTRLFRRLTHSISQIVGCITGYKEYKKGRRKKKREKTIPEENKQASPLLCCSILGLLHVTVSPVRGLTCYRESHELHSRSTDVMEHHHKRRTKKRRVIIITSRQDQVTNKRRGSMSKPWGESAWAAWP
jgi:hypothetical protein